MVEIRDAQGNLTDSTANVTMTVSVDGTVVGTATVAAVDGVATFTNVGISGTAADYTLTFASDGLTSDTQTITLGAGAADELVLTTDAAGAASGAAFETQPVVEIRDAQGNLTDSTANVTMTVSVDGTVVGTATVAAVDGVATFTNVGISGTADDYTLTFASDGLTSDTQTITLGAGAADELVLTTDAAGAASGAAFETQPVVEIRDAQGNLTDSTANVTMTVSVDGTVVGTATVAAVDGVATFTNVGISGTADDYTLTFASDGLTSDTQTITLGAGAADAGSSTIVASLDTGVTADGADSSTLTITVRDANNNLVDGQAVFFAITGGTGGTLSSGPWTTNSSGVATATLTSTNATTLTVTGYLGTDASGTSVGTDTVTFVAGVASQLAITQEPVGGASGAALGTQPVVTIQDAQGNTVTTDSSTVVTVAIFSGAGGTLGETLTATASSGVATFSGVTLAGTVGTNYVLRFTSSPVLTTNDSAIVTVTAGVASQLAITQEPVGGASGAALGTQPVVTIQDAQGNTVTTDSSTVVTVAIGSGAGGTLGGTLTATASSGVATFSGVTLAGTVGTNYVLRFTSSPVLTTNDSANVTVTAGVASQLAITQEPVGGASGAALGTQPVVTIQDAQGNTVTTDSSTVVTVAIGSGAGGTLGGTLTATASSGVATFSGVTLAGTVGTDYVLRFTSSPVLTADDSANVTVTAGVASQLAITTEPVGGASGAALTTQPVVTIQDAQGNTVTTDSSTVVTVAIGSGGGGTLGETLTATASSGVATFSGVTLAGTVGTDYVLRFTSSPVLTADDSANVTVTAGVASQLAITTDAADAASGAAFETQPVVEIRDAEGNLTDSTANVTMTVSVDGTVVGTATVAAVDGVATFTNVGISGTAADYTLTFASGVLDSDTQTITLGAGAADELVLTTDAAGAASGAAFETQPVVEIRDAQGNLTDSTANVTMTVSVDGTVVGTATVAAVDGVATFTNVGISGTAADYTLTFASDGLTSDTQTITLGAGAADELVLTTDAAGAASGAAFETQPVVEIRDAQGNLTDSTANVTMTVSVDGTVVGTATVAAVGGVATFTNVGISGTAADYTLTFASDGLDSDTQTITLGAGAADELVLTTDAAGAASGAAFETQPVVEIRDAEGNLTDSTANVTMTVSVDGTVVGTATVAAVDGVATFTNVGISGTAADYTLTFASDGLTSDTQTITLGAGAADELVLTTDAAGAASGAAFETQPVVKIRDAQGNLTDSTANVTMTVSADGTVVGTATVAAVDGVATFTNVGISGTAADYTLTFASDGLTSDTQTITLGAGAADELVLTTDAAGAASGAAFETQPVVEIRDAQGNLTDSTANVTMTVSVDGTVVGTATVAAVGGVATFTNVGISGTAADYTLTFASDGLTSDTQTITLGAGAASQLAITTDAAGAASGAAFETQPVVEIRDAQGNLTDSTANVTMTVSVDGTVVGTATVAAVDGVATFTNVGISGTAADYTLTFASDGLTSDTQTITLGAGAADELVLTTDAAGAASGAAFETQPVVEIRDAQGNLTDSTANVTMTVSVDGTVVGTATVAAVDGVATFTNVGISGTAADYTLTFASDGLTSDTQTITLGAGAADELVLTTDAAGAASGAAFETQPVVEIRDAEGNLTDSTANVTMTVSVDGTVVGTATVAAVDGVATFTNVGISGTAADYTLTFASDGLTSDTQTITLGAGAAAELVFTGNAAANLDTGVQRVLRVEARDAQGNLVTGFTESVTFAKTSGTGTVTGLDSVNAAGGVATLTVTGGDAGSVTITATSGDLDADSTTFTVVGPADASQSTIGAVSSVVADGVSISTITVRAKDANGVNLNTGGATVVVTLATGDPVSLSDVTDFNNGVYTFTASSTTTGVRTFTATLNDEAVENGTGSQQSVTVTFVPGAADELVLTTDAAGAASGAAFETQPVVEIRDAQGNLTGSTANVTMTVSVDGTVVGTATVAAVDGVATFTNVGISGTAADYTLTFASGVLTSDTQTITLGAGAADELVLTTDAAGAASGAAFETQPVVEIRDAQGNLTDSTANVTMTVSVDGTVVGTATVAAVGGVATFTNVGISGTAADYTLTFASDGLTSDTQTITLGAGAASQLAITTDAAGAASGAAFETQPVVEIRDAQGNLTDSTANVTMTVSVDGTVVGTATVAAVDGVATFTNVGISGTAADYTLTFASDGLTSDTQTITLGAGAADELVLTTDAAGAASGAAFETQPVVEIRDAQGNLTDSTANVTMTVSVDGTVVGTATVAAVDGVATFTNVGISGTAADYTLTFASDGLTSDTQTITLGAGAADELVLTTDAAGAASGAAFETQPVVEIRDAEGNLTDSTANVTMTVSVDGTVVGTATVAAVGGVATFTNVGISGTAADYTLTFASDGLTSDTQTITLGAGAADELVLTTDAAGAASGAAFETQPVVEIRDAEGNLTDSTANVTMTVSVDGTVVGTATVAAVDGVATFTNVGISGTADDYTLTFASDGLTSDTQTITLGAGAADAGSSTIVASLDTGVTADGADSSTLTITVRDANNNLVDGQAVFFAITGGTGGTLSSGPWTTNSSGVATATLTSTNATTLTVTGYLGTDASGTSVGTDTVTFVAGVASQLAITQEPVGGASGAALGTQPVVTIQDAQGNTVTTDSSTVVTVAIFSGAGGTLGETLTATASSGVATFSGVTLAGTVGTNYVLRFTSSPVLTADDSANVTVTAGVASQLAITQEPVGGASGAALTTQPVVTIQDAQGNTVTTDSSTVVTVAIFLGAGGTLGETLTATASSGVATFSGVTLAGTVGTDYVLRFTSGSLTAADSANVTVTAGVATKLVFTSGTTNLATGTTRVLTVQARDAQDNLVTGFTGSVAFAKTGGPGTVAVLLGLSSVDAVVGVATLTVTGGDAGSVTITATSGDLTPGSTTFTVGPVVTATQAVASTVLTQDALATPFTPVTGGGGTETRTFAITPGLPAGLTFSTSTGQITGTPTATLGSTTFTVTVTDANGATDTETFVLTVNGAVTATQAVASTVLTQDALATPFTPVTGGGGTGTRTFALSGGTLPDGLTFSTTTGQITGTPTATLTLTTFTVTVTDDNSATATQTFDLTVNGAVTATQAVASTVLTQDALATPFTPVTGGGGTGTRTFAITPGLPAGLTFSTSTGQITGTPTATLGSTTFTVTVTDDNGATATETFVLTVNGAVTATQAVASTVLTQDALATAFTPVTGGGGTGTRTFALSGGTLPDGLTFSTTTGQITGTPTATLTLTTFTVTVTDDNSATATQTFDLTVNGAVTATQAVASTVLTQDELATPFTPGDGWWWDGGRGRSRSRPGCLRG